MTRKKKEEFEVEIIEGYVWCNHHGEVHEESTNPYDGAPYDRDENGRPYWMTEVSVDADDNPLIYGSELHRAVGTKIVPMAPECTQANWTSLYRSEGVYEGEYA